MHWYVLGLFSWDFEFVSGFAIRISDFQAEGQPTAIRNEPPFV
jgi:hypothetical protein